MYAGEWFEQPVSCPRSPGAVGSPKHAVQWGIIPRNPCEAVSPPRPQRSDVQVPEVDAIKRFLEDAKDSPFVDAFKLALYTGLRRSELTGLKWEDIDFTTSTLRVTGNLQRISGKGLVAGPPKTRPAGGL